MGHAAHAGVLATALHPMSTLEGKRYAPFDTNSATREEMGYQFA